MEETGPTVKTHPDYQMTKTEEQQLKSKFRLKVHYKKYVL